MKTINVPLVGSCPTWSDEIPPGRITEFRGLIDHVHQNILVSASNSLITPYDLRSWHSSLFSPFVPLHYYAGYFRGIDRNRPCLEQNVYIPSSGATGCDYAAVQAEMDFCSKMVLDDFSKLELNWPYLTPADRVLQLAIIIGNFVGFFIKIHPFINGNGRISRLIWRGCLLRFGVAPQCCTYPRPAQPYGAIMDSAMRGDHRPIIMFILQHLNQNAPDQI